MTSSPGQPPPGVAPVVGALLAGGASRRMGRDKAHLDLQGETLWVRAARALAWTDERVQSGGEALPGLGWPVLPDPTPGRGPAGALAGLLRAFPRSPIVLRAVDLPYADEALLRATLTLALEGRSSGSGVAAAVPRHAGRWHPLAATWMPAAAPLLARRLATGRLDLQGLLDELPVAPLEGARLAALGPPETLLANVNTPADLERLRRRTSPGDPRAPA